MKITFEFEIPETLAPLFKGALPNALGAFGVKFALKDLNTIRLDSDKATDILISVISLYASQQDADNEINNILNS